MGYRSLAECVGDLERVGQLVRVDHEVDPNLEVGLIQRRVTAVEGPAILFTKVKGSHFPLLGNLFGTLARTRYLFRDTLEGVSKLIQLKINPGEAISHPWRYRSVLRSAWHLRPRKTLFAPVLKNETRISVLPQLKSWPNDGGAFITLPQVYTEDVSSPGWRHSNLGMYRIQISGNQYNPDKEVGLHYQIHRGIGVHHEKAQSLKVPFRVAIFVGGPPAMTLAAVMPLPEGLTELAFAGALGGRRIPLCSRGGGLPVHAEADFCIMGTVEPHHTLPEGPFGDHLGYYSLQHPYPVLNVDKVFHRDHAIWPFTTVGRPPQEDTIFGKFIHELTGPLIPNVLPGVHGVHAVDSAGVHPLLLAIGSERYRPYQDSQRPEEILTQAHAILGQGQLSLAKYLWIANHADCPGLNINDIAAFFRHMLERVDFARDLHFETQTTIDTLDYSGEGLHQGSKVVVAAVGNPKRKLATELKDLFLGEEVRRAALCLPGVLALEVPKFESYETERVRIERWSHLKIPEGYPLIVLVDDADFTARTENNFIWVTFTRSDPARDIYGKNSFFEHKHWGCMGPLIIDARLKPHHAPPLEDDPKVVERVNALASPGGPLHGIF